MKKLYLLIFLAFTLFIGNYALWFMETRSINKMLLEYKRELGRHNIVLKHDSIQYSSFKSWRVEGKIEDVSIRYNMASPKIIHADKLRFVVRPFSKSILLRVDSDVELAYVQVDGDRDEYKFKFNGELPRLNLELIDDFKEVVDILQDADEPKLPLVSSLNYSDGGFVIESKSDESIHMTSGSNKIDITTEKTDDFSAMTLILGINDLELVNEKYFSNKVRELGVTTYTIDLTYKKLPSDNLLERIKKNSKVKKIFDAYSVDIRELRQSSEKSSTNLVGFVTRQPESVIPYMDVVLSLEGYKHLLNYGYSNYNKSIEPVLRENPLLPLKPIDEEKAVSLTELMERISRVEGENMYLTLKHDRKSGFKVGNANVIDVLADFQNIVMRNN